MPRKGNDARNTGWGAETALSKKDRGGQVPTIDRRGYPLDAEPATRTSDDIEQDVPAVEGRGYSARPNTTARGRRVQDGIKDTSGPPIEQ